MVTPSGLTFAIWGIIFLAQGIFTVVQMLPAYRANKLVQHGVSYLYFAACVAQSIWTFVFGYEIIWSSAIVMGAILASLVYIVWRLSKMEHDKKEFWLFKFPFSIHCGWIAAAFAVNVNAFIVAAGGGRVALISWAYLTLLWAILVAVFALVYLRSPDYTIAGVLIWATIGIASELNDPLDGIAAVFTQNQISAVRNAVIAVCALVSVATAGFAGFRIVKGRDVRELPEDEEIAYEGHTM